ncbi:MAG: hypothetical protein LWW77_12040 [Propionibacteriales bacterium]|nr:hypothetical protein [Propionibacteriales bacterium]
MDWLGIGIIVVVGIAVVAYGWLSDRTANRRRAEALNAPPDRPIPGLKPDADAPRYVLPDDLDATPSLPAAELATLRDRLSAATSLPHGHGKGAFASDHASGLAVLAEPLILIVDGDLSSTRELLPVIAKAATARRPLVVVAERIDADVFHTLEANTLAGKLAADAVPITDPARRAHLAELVDASAISPANLKAGWVPDTSLGTCGTWVSSPTQLWLLDD